MVDVSRAGYQDDLPYGIFGDIMRNLDAEPGGKTPSRDPHVFTTCVAVLVPRP